MGVLALKRLEAVHSPCDKRARFQRGSVRKSAGFIHGGSNEAHVGLKFILYPNTRCRTLAVGGATVERAETRECLKLALFESEPLVYLVTELHPACCEAQSTKRQVTSGTLVVLWRLGMSRALM
jgi:hypothetical protein